MYNLTIYMYNIYIYSVFLLGVRSFGVNSCPVPNPIFLTRLSRRSQAGTGLGDFTDAMRNPDVWHDENLHLGHRFR